MKDWVTILEGMHIFSEEFRNLELMTKKGHQKFTRMKRHIFC